MSVPKDQETVCGAQWQVFQMGRSGVRCSPGLSSGTNTVPGTARLGARKACAASLGGRMACTAHLCLCSTSG